MGTGVVRWAARRCRLLWQPAGLSDSATVPVMSAQWRHLAEGLVSALEPVLPRGFEVSLEAEAGGIAIFKPGVPHAWVLVGVQPLIEQPGDERQLVEAACYSVLSTAQDFVAEFTGMPWPAGEKEPPLPDVEVLDADVRLWYGRRQSPTLVVGPIRWR